MGRESFEDYSEIVCTVLDCIQKSGLTISAKMTKIACAQVVFGFLGGQARDMARSSEDKMLVELDGCS